MALNSLKRLFRGRGVIRVLRTFVASLRVLGMELGGGAILPPEGGVPIIMETPTRRLFGIHPWIWMDRRYVPTTSFVFTGGKNGGKTSAAKLIMLFTSMLDMGGRRARVIYDNMRTDKGVPEDEVLLQVYGKHGTRIKVREARINPYDYRLGFSPSQHLRWTLAMVHDLTGLKFNEFEIIILSQMIRKMMTQSTILARPTLLVEMCEEYAHSDYIYNIKVRRNKLIKAMGNNPDALQMLNLVLKPTEGWHDRLSANKHPELVTQAAMTLAAKLQANLLEGRAGEIFGDENSLPEMMGDYLFVSQDLTGVDDDLASAYHYLSRMYIGNAGMFDIIVQDETSKSWRYASWAAAESDEEWQIREFSPFKIRIIQELDLLKMSADKNSRQYEMAVNSVKGAGAHFIFGGQSSEAYDQLGELLGFSKLNVAWLKSLNTGVYKRRRNDKLQMGRFGLMPKDGSFVRGQINPVSPLEKAIIDSNAAVKDRTGRRARKAALSAQR